MASTNQFLADLDKKLWSADKLRSDFDAAVYKHAVLGLIFLKYVSDAFEIRQQEFEAKLRDANADYYLDPAGYDTTWRMAAMNMAIRGIDFNFGKEPANSFTKDQHQHPDQRADYVMANLPAFVSRFVRDRNAEAQRTQSSCSSISSALSASPRFKTFRDEIAEHGYVCLLYTSPSPRD